MKNFTIQNVYVTGSAPKSLVVKGYPTRSSSYIDISLRNISFNGITDHPHFLLENVNYVWVTDVSVNGKEWNDVPGNEALSSGVIVNKSGPALIALVVLTIVSAVVKIE